MREPGFQDRDESQMKTFDQRVQMSVIGVDEFAAELAVLAVRKSIPNGLYSPAGPRACLENGDIGTRPRELMRRRKARKACSAHQHTMATHM
jgi:hypothetical protein